MKTTAQLNSLVMRVYHNVLPNMFITFMSDDMSVLTHTYPHKPQGNIKVTIYNHQAEWSFYLFG